MPNILSMMLYETVADRALNFYIFPIYSIRIHKKIWKLVNQGGGYLIKRKTKRWPLSCQNIPLHNTNKNMFCRKIFNQFLTSIVVKGHSPFLVLDHPLIVFMLLPSVKDVEIDNGPIIVPVSSSASFTEGRSMKTISG